jgi:GMP synthase-like glutamine amidotransferase
MVTGGGRVYATQFHPELTRDDNLLRFQRYEVQYKKAFGLERYARMVEGFQPSPHASSVLGRFRALLEADFRAG